MLAASLWLLNPFLVSTTLYVVQRMTQLAALFSLLGIWGYLLGREWLSTSPRLGYATITLSVTLGTGLAVLSKENGALLPLLILVIEATLRSHWTTPGPSWQWKLVFLTIPASAVLAYLAMKLPGLVRPIPTREFTLLERLLTQPRILWDYLFHLFVPHIQTRGLYQDGIVISTGLATPWTTALALVGLVVLGVGGWLARHRWPLVSLGILFFLAGHLLESTTIALELYFEHRNYLPAVFLFLPVAAGIVALRTRIRPALVVFIALALNGSFAIATWQWATVWGDEDQLTLVWAETNPTSPRAQNEAARTWLNLGHPDRAIAVLKRAIAANPNSALLTSSYLTQRTYLGQITPLELKKSLDKLRDQPFDPQMLRVLKHLVELVNASAPAPEHAELLLSYLRSLREDLDGRVPVAHRYSYYLQGLLLSGQGDGQRALPYLEEALSHYGSIETGLHIVSLLATHGHYREALIMLDQSSLTLHAQPDSTLGRYRSTYENEIERLRQTLRDDLVAQGQQTPEAVEPVN